MSNPTSVTKYTAPAALMLLLNTAEPVAALVWCYKAFPQRLSWSSGNTECGSIPGSQNGKLVQILNPVIQTVVEQAIVNDIGADAVVEGDKHDGYWVGAQTVGNAQTDYTNWAWIDGVEMYTQQGHINGFHIGDTYNNWVQSPKMPDYARWSDWEYQTCMQVVVNWDSDNTNAPLAQDFQWDNYWCDRAGHHRRYVCEYQVDTCGACDGVCLPEDCNQAHNSISLNEDSSRCCPGLANAVTYDGECNPASCKQDEDAGEYFVVNDAAQPKVCCADMDYAASFNEDCTLKDCQAGAAKSTADTCCPAIEHATTIDANCLAQGCGTGFVLNNDNTACCGTAGREGVLTFGAECAVLACEPGADNWVPNTPTFTAETSNCCRKEGDFTTYDEECNPNHCADGQEPNVPRGPVCCPINGGVKTHTEGCVPATCNEGFSLDVPASPTGCCATVDDAATYAADCTVATCNLGYVRNDDNTGCVVPSLADGNCPVIEHAVTYRPQCGVETCEKGYKTSADASSCEAPLVGSGSEDDGFNPLWLLLLLLIPCLAIPAVLLFLRKKKEGGSKKTHADEAILEVKAESEGAAAEDDDAPATVNAEENGAGEQAENDVFDL